MPIRMTGMISGMDTESLIKSMVDAQKLKNKRTTDKSTLLEWKQDKWKDLNTKLLKLYQEDLSKLRLQGSYGGKKVTTTNDALVTITGGSSAPTGSASLQITQTASVQSVTSKRLGAGVTGDTALKSLAGAGFEVGKEIIITNGSKASSLVVGENTTINDFIAAAKSAGLNASYDTVQQRIFVSGKESGKDNTFSIQQHGSGAAAAQDGLKSLVGFSSMNDGDKKKVLTALNDLYDEDKKTAAIDVLRQYATARVQNSVSNKVGADATKHVMDEITNSLLSETALGAAADSEFTDRYSAVGGFENSEDFQKIRSSLIKEKGYVESELTPEDEDELLQLATTQQKTTIKKEILGKEYLYQTEYDKEYKKAYDIRVAELKEQIASEGLNLSEEDEAAYIATNLNLDIDAIKNLANDNISTSVSTDYIRAFNEAVNKEYATTERQNEVQAYRDTNYPIEEAAALGVMEAELTTQASQTSGTPNAYNALASLGLGAVTGAEGNVLGGEDNMTVMAAQNAEIKYNNVAMTSNSNTFSVNGLTIAVRGTTAPGETINVDVKNDTQANYDMVKKFVTNYNEILKEMNELFYAPSSRGYDPLSDDEKEAMSEKQIDKWEDKIKSSVLRRDDTLGSLISTLNMAAVSVVEVDGKRYSLNSFGIGTSKDYSEKGLLHIDGDADDALVSSLTNKLMKALEEDPELVGKVISGISKNIYDALGEKSKGISNVRSALTFYNDKTMTKQQQDYQKKVKELEQKLVTIENKYYKQFAAMETALSKLQSQSNTLAGMLGMGQGQR